MIYVAYHRWYRKFKYVIRIQKHQLYETKYYHEPEEVATMVYQNAHRLTFGWSSRTERGIPSEAACSAVRCTYNLRASLIRAVPLVRKTSMEISAQKTDLRSRHTHNVCELSFLKSSRKPCHLINTDFHWSIYSTNQTQNSTFRSCPIFATTNAAVDPVPNPSTIPLSTYSTACSSARYKRENAWQLCSNPQN